MSKLELKNLELVELQSKSLDLITQILTKMNSNMEKHTKSLSDQINISNQKIEGLTNAILELGNLLKDKKN